ncbi:MAG: hypothetical protein U0K87_04710 [Ruminococcus sp.]|nr:hypothetical protein [Ruminococcus sp.]
MIFNCTTGKKVEDVTYVVGEPVDFTLSADKWQGTNYELAIPNYESIGNVQIGIPSSSSAANTERLIAAALTVPRTASSTDSDTGVKTLSVIINAVYPPTEDITIALFGIKEVAAPNE